MLNKDIFKEYNTENWVIEENLCYLLQMYKEELMKNKDPNILGFVKNFMKQETFIEVEYAEKSKMDTVETNVIDVDTLDAELF